MIFGRYAISPFSAFAGPLSGRCSPDWSGLSRRARIAYLPAMSLSVREEHDLLGTRKISNDHYYGIQTLRAVENFPITGIRISQYPHLINALAAVKQAAATTNCELELLDQKIC